MNHSTPGVCVQLPESTQTHIHQVDDAIQQSHLLSSPSLPTFNLSQHQGLFQQDLLIFVAKVWSLMFDKEVQTPVCGADCHKCFSEKIKYYQQPISTSGDAHHH